MCLLVWVLSRFSHVRLFATLWTVAPQALLSMGFSRQEYWSGLPSSPPGGGLPDPGIEPRFPALQGDSLLSEPPDGTGVNYKLQEVTAPCLAPSHTLAQAS